MAEAHRLATSISLITCFIVVINAKMGFLKDQSMDAVFPGPVFKIDSSLPEGHMRPLGWQRRSDGPVDEVDEMLGTGEFYEEYTSMYRPVVFRNGAGIAPVFVTWEEDDHILDKYGEMDLTVQLKVKKHIDEIHSTLKPMKLKKFLYDYMYDNVYLSTVMPSELMEEFPLPACLRCGTINERLISARLWMSSGGTSSLLHSHDNHLLHCVVFGRRDFILIHGHHKKYFKFHLDYLGSDGGHSDMNTEIVNTHKFKDVGRVPWRWSTLFGGDCIFVPAGYMHQVRSHGRSVSFTVEFAPVQNFDDTGCTLSDEEFLPLSDAHYMWAFEDGRLRLSDVNLDAEAMRHVLITLTGKLHALTIHRFVHFYKTAVGDAKVPPAVKVFHYMTTTTDEMQVALSEIQRLPEEVLNKIAAIFNGVYRASLGEEVEPPSEGTPALRQEL